MLTAVVGKDEDANHDVDDDHNDDRDDDLGASHSTPQDTPTGLF